MGAARDENYLSSCKGARKSRKLNNKFAEHSGVITVFGDYKNSSG